MQRFARTGVIALLAVVAASLLGESASAQCSVPELVHRPISSLWNRLAFVGLDGGEAFWGEGPDSPWWSR